jgi:hypothetical protein
MTDLMAGEIIAILLLAVGLVTLLRLLCRDTEAPVARPQNQQAFHVETEPTVDEDINHPSVELVDEALRHVGRDNRGAQDWLLDKRIKAMQRETS